MTYAPLTSLGDRDLLPIASLRASSGEDFVA